MTVAGSEPRRDLRRSTRVPIRVRIEVKATGFSCEGETVIVNLHGALLRSSAKLDLGAGINLYVPLTGKSAHARVVFASKSEALHFGVALDRPENIWGISLPPRDWEEIESDR